LNKLAHFLYLGLPAPPCPSNCTLEVQDLVQQCVDQQKADEQVQVERNKRKRGWPDTPDDEGEFTCLWHFIFHDSDLEIPPTQMPYTTLTQAQRQS
jgi:hypothetical protein